MNVVIGPLEIRDDIEGECGIDHARLSAMCTCDEWSDPKELYFEVPSPYREGLCARRVDSFVVGLLTWAMWKAYSTQEEVTIVSETPISDRLLFQLEQTYVPVVSRQLADRYAPVSFDMPVSSERIEGEKSAATGVSGGIDSTYNILKLSGGGYPKLKYGITCDFDSPRAKSRTEKSKSLVNVTEKICAVHKLEHIVINSNFTEELYGLAHAAIIDPLIMAHALALQNMIGVYCVGSTYLFEEFSFNPEDVSQFELFIATYMSTQDLQFYTIGSEVTRFEKTRLIAEFEEPKHYLMPCSVTSSTKCCNRCSKCTRTMCTLWCLDKLDEFRDIFDVDLFYSDMNYHLGYLIMRRRYHFNKEILNECKRTGHKIPLSAWVAAFVKWARRGFRATNPAASEYRPK